MSDVVLDASALIALLRSERGAHLVAAAIPGAAISAVNLSEVASWLSDAGAADGEIRETLGGLDLDLHPFNRDTAFRSASLRRDTRHKGLSFGDRACLALAVKTNLPALTADRSWAELEIGVDIRLIRE